MLLLLLGRSPKNMVLLVSFPKVDALVAFRTLLSTPPASSSLCSPMRRRTTARCVFVCSLLLEIHPFTCIWKYMHSHAGNTGPEIRPGGNPTEFSPHWKSQSILTPPPCNMTVRWICGWLRHPAGHLHKQVFTFMDKLSPSKLGFHLHFHFQKHAFTSELRFSPS